VKLSQHTGRTASKENLIVAKDYHLILQSGERLRTQGFSIRGKMQNLSAVIIYMAIVFLSSNLSHVDLF
jgi:hypothetical protein